ncbi:RICIN domain-containing protein [Streptomyces sp. JNUCC 64]
MPTPLPPRPDRDPDPAPGPAGPVHRATGPRGRHRGRPAPLPRTAGAGGPGRNLLTWAALGAGALALAVLAAALWPGGGEGAAGHALPEATAVGTGAPGHPGETAPVPAAGALRGGLRNVESGLCLDVVGGRPVAGARATVRPCAGGRTQWWAYEGDGLLRSGADPALCLDAHTDRGVVALDTCGGRDQDQAMDVRYDLTVQGQLVPRWKDGLALAPTAPGTGADVVVRVRDRSARQRWIVDPRPDTRRSKARDTARGSRSGPPGRRPAAAPRR